MGQQQLLLIVLGVIIVGVAIVAGIGLFNAGAEEATKDELVSQCMAIGANAQQWYKKPVAMGGGGGSFSTAGGAAVAYSIPLRMEATANAGGFDADGVPDDPGYEITTAGDQQIVITATPNLTDYKWTVKCTVDPSNIKTVVTANPAN